MHIEPSQRIQTSEEEPIEWILVEEPPDQVPVPVLQAAEGREALPNQSQEGVLVMCSWVVAGQPVARELQPPFPWPSPLPITGNVVAVDLGTKVAPIEVETRVARSVDEQGVPLTLSASVWCKYLTSSSGCQITRNGEEDNWKIVMELPAERGTCFISLRGSWGLPLDSSISNVTDATSFDAGWLFAVANP